MSKYKLTTDLIADCTALIPQNVERLNEEAKKINKTEGFFDLYIAINQSKIDFINFTAKNRYELTFGIKKEVWDYMSPGLQFIFISHCLRTIPEFQAENPEYKNYSKRKQDLEEEYPLFTEDDFTLDPDDYCRDYADYEYFVLLCRLTPKTISSATLHGQGEFPPNTLEELCESYKNVMSE